MHSKILCKITTKNTSKFFFSSSKSDIFELQQEIVAGAEDIRRYKNAVSNIWDEE